VLEPSTPLEWGWHIDVLCDHVQALIEGQWQAQADPNFDQICQNLAVNVPPGTLKSRILSVYAPAWAWIHKPEWRVLALSANPTVADRDADLSKQLITSEWYHERFIATLPERKRWTLRKDKDGVRNFHNTRGGYRVSRGLNATVTGLRGDAILVDDPNDSKDVSDVKLQAVADKWRAASNRVNDERVAIRILIQQRIHERDLTGTIFDKGASDAEGVDWHHLVIPMEREPEHNDEGKPIVCAACKVKHGPSFIGWVDARAEGEVLHPDRNTPKVLAATKRKLGSYGSAGQLQQRPSPLEGGLFKKKFWRTYDNLEMNASGVPKFDKSTLSVDATFKEEGTSQVALGVIIARGPKRFVIEVIARKMGYNEMIGEIRALKAKYPWIQKILIEDKANGSAAIETLTREFSGVVPCNPQGGKVSRAVACLPTVEAGDVYLPRHAAWREDFVEEFATFPNGAYDDQVDMVTQALADMSGMTPGQRMSALGNL
jgi:predicted phage terminase large subunit-like protein